MKRTLLLSLVAISLLAPRFSQAQERGAAALGEDVLGLGVTPRVLVIGAHPDDEDTQLIAWLAKGRHVETAYLSLTRGDGGQNLIGNELGPALGIIRTEELLAARRLDGGRQYFTRAYDFGFSRTAEETFKHWARDSILQDVVTIIRAYRPQVIVSIWSGTPRDGHGHHQVSGLLARDAFEAAADTVRFPRDRTEGLGPWAPLKFYRSARFNNAGGATVTFDAGEYDPLVGRSYAEIATESRSQHASQGQGNVPRRGARPDFLRLELSRTGGTLTAATGASERSIFDGVDTSLARFAAVPLRAEARSALDSLSLAVAAVRRSASLMNPVPIVAPLATYLRLVDAVRHGTGCRMIAVPRCEGALGDLAVAMETQHQRATDALLAAAGIGVEADAERELVASGDSVPVRIDVFNQGAVPVELLGARVSAWYSVPRDEQLDVPRSVPSDSAVSITLPLHIEAITQSWWLSRPRSGDMFRLTGGGAGSTPYLSPTIMGEDRVSFTRADVQLRVAGVPVTAVVSPIVYRYADRVHGERRRPVAGVPGIAILLERELEYAGASAPIDRVVRVHLQSARTADCETTVSIQLPRGLTADSAARHVVLKPFGSADLYFRVRGTLSPGQHTLTVEAKSGGDSFATGYVPIEYEHIRPQRFYGAAAVTLQAVDTKLPAGLRVGYVAGVSDNVAPMLEELGIPVTLVDPATLPQTDLSRFTTIVVGPRAYGADPALVAHNARLLRFVRNGGTLVVQYGQAEMGQPGIMPYPIAPARTTDRVTEEDAAVTVTDPASLLLNVPNRITDADFGGWVQERATYMPVQFDPRYHTILSMHDTGVPALTSAILVAPYGRGTYVYTTLSFFRQLPAGNPGAARLFVNLLAAGRR